MPAVAYDVCKPSGPANDHGNSSAQLLTLVLEGITADDYLGWLFDPEPPALGSHLRSVTVRAAPRGERIDADLVWDGRATPSPRAAAIAAGFTLTPEVAELRARRQQNSRPTEVDANGSEPQAATQRADRLVDTSDDSTPARIDHQQCNTNTSTEERK
jgi:hypothetical protein